MKTLFAFCVLASTQLFACPELAGIYDCPKGSGIITEEFKQVVSPAGIMTYEETTRFEGLAQPVTQKYPVDGKEYPYKHLSGEVSMAQASCYGLFLQVRIRSKFAGVNDGALRFMANAGELTVFTGTLDKTKFEEIDQVCCRKR